MNLFNSDYLIACITQFTSMTSSGVGFFVGFLLLLLLSMFSLFVFFSVPTMNIGVAGHE